MDTMKDSRVDKSPYFSSSVPSVVSPAAKATVVERSHRLCSDYFLRSPSSAHGAVQSLGPLLLTWCNSIENCTFEHSQHCTRQQAEHDDNTRSTATFMDVCSECQPVIDDALQRFEQCHLFQKERKQAMMLLTTATSSGSTSQSCVESVGELAKQHMLRHLCDHQCYLRAFAPQRDWLALRNAVQNHCTHSVDALLRNWTCCLVEEREDHVNNNECKGSDDDLNLPDGNEQSGNHLVGQPARQLFQRTKRRNPACTVYVQKVTYEKVSNASSVLRHIGCLKRPREDGWRIESTKTGWDDVDVQMCPRREQTLSIPCSSEQNWNAPHPFLQSGDMTSPFGLMEELFTESPWRLLICAIFLNRTQRKMMDRTLFLFLERWPDASHLLKYARHEETLQDLIQLVAPLGLTYKRARGLVRFCREYVSLIENKNGKNSKSSEGVSTTLSRSEVTCLFFCGAYAADAYQIFIRQDVQSPVVSNDHALLAYVDWKRSQTII